MPNHNTKLTPEFYQSLNNRSDASIELESINHYLCLFFMSHPGLQQEIEEYHVAQDYLETIAGNDLEVDTHLKLTLAADYYRSCFGHTWQERRDADLIAGSR